MKKVFRILYKTLLYILLFIILAVVVYYIAVSVKVSKLYDQLGPEASSIVIDGQSFRDLNKNGSLDVYEDTRVDFDRRVDDLVSQMTLEEKAGSMFVSMIGMTGKGGLFDKPTASASMLNNLMSLAFPSSAEMLIGKKINSYNILDGYPADILARFNNNIQSVAEKTRLGIPVTIATDPRHGTENNPGANIYSPAFSQWPTSLGLAATRDTLLVREFGDIARQEYRAVGISLALHPMADLATEPRWGRTNGTFGEDAALSAAMTKAYVLGFQGDSLDQQGVACMTKHFSGGGPQKDGEDAHFPYGKDQVYPGNNFDYHVIPFIDGAFPAKTAQIMPYYGIPVGQTSEDVGFAFNREIITGLLRDSLGFEGVVCADWAIISDSKVGDARAWGVEDLTALERAKKVIDAGCDQFGGEFVPELIVDLVESGQIKESRIDVSVKRILLDKFRLGLFDDPYVDEEEATELVGNEDFKRRGKAAQAKSTILCKNEGLLPLQANTKIYATGITDPSGISSPFEWVESPEEADVIVRRIRTPYEDRKDYFLESFFHQGRLYYTDDELAEILDYADVKPTIYVANLERPTILTPVNDAAAALLVEFGTSDEVLIDMLSGKREPQGQLPFELPSSWEAVQKQLEDVPYDSEDPLYPFGHGLRYE
ncbi:MAG: glycoside hydrolase family 3 protein [Saprospiraceae bacterium]|nr:glycoside hydrolase family 3 protein [Saprospiraceae bacterium]